MRSSSQIINVAHHLCRDLDLSRENTEVSFALQTAASVSSPLRRLDLSWCAKLPRPVFLQCLPRLAENLRSLSLSHSKSVSDAHLAVLGAYAEGLEELDVGFTGAGNAGVTCLCRPVDEDGRADERFGRCRHIRSLNLEHTNVDAEGATM